MQPRCQRYRGGLAYERAVDILERRVDEERLVLVVLLARVLRYLLLEELCAQADPGELNRRLSVVQVGSAALPTGLKPQRGTQVGKEGANSHL